MVYRSPRQKVTRWSTAGLILAGFLAFLAPFSPAQTFFGSVVGTVTDTTGGVVPGASVTLTNTGTSERHSVPTDENGNYRFVNLVPGMYRLDIEISGFKRLTRDAIQVQVEAAVRINAVMQVGGVNETVEVTSQTPLLQTENSSLSQVVEGRTVLEMPLNGRNVLNLVAFTPGVVAQYGTSGNPQGNMSDGKVTQPVAWAGYQIGGGQTNTSATFFDGVSVNSPYVNATVLVPTQDAVQEFRVASSSISAEFGRFAGGVVNFTSKSGTNQFHGTAYEYFRNKVLNANNFFNNSKGVPRPNFNQNQFGANVNGPIIKDKTFFMFNWEQFKLRFGIPLLFSVPTQAMRDGDFSASNFAKIYDPLTVCGKYGNPACQKDANGKDIVVRQQFSGNKIPANRINPTSKYMLYYWGLPTGPGTTNNWAGNGPGGGNQYQMNTRVDQVISDKQRMFGRYTRWVGTSIPYDPWNNKIMTTWFEFKNDSFVFGDTYAFSSTTILDMRLSYMRFRFGSYQTDEGHDMCLYGPNYCKLNDQMTFRIMIGTVIPGVTPDIAEWTNRDKSDTETLSAGLTKIKGRHTLKFGGESRFIDWGHTMLNPASGVGFRYSTGWTNMTPGATAGSGVAFASFLLGYMDSGTAYTIKIPAARQWYNGLYVTDTFQASKKLTLNFGLRWEYPGSFYERNDSAVVLLHDATNPLSSSVGIPLKGNVPLVNSQDYPDRKMHPAKWTLFGPRLGMAYRLDDRTVIRAGYGISYLSNDAVVTNAPWATAPNKATTTVTTTLDNITPYSDMTNPFPNGLLQPPGHSSTVASTLYGTDVVAPVPDVPYPYIQQWNLAVQRELPGGLALDFSYSGSKGTHMPIAPLINVNNPTFNVNQIPDQYLSMGTALTTPVPNPFYGKVPASAGKLAQPTIMQGQLLRPMPQYLNVNNPANNGGYSLYNSLQAKVEKRFGAGGSLLATYAWAKNIGTSDSLTSWTENPDTGGAVQNWNNVNAEKSLLNYDIPHNFTLSYVIDLPVGKGKRFWNGVSGASDKLLSGWGFGGNASMRTGYPLHLTAQATTLSTNFGGGVPRPNVVAGCQTEIEGSAQSKLNKWFNTSCFSQPGPFAFGNEGRSNSTLRSHGVNNWDISIWKNTAITEQVRLRFETQIFNIANRTQFSPPTMQVGNALFGVVAGTRNLPRLVQFALRLTF